MLNYAISHAHVHPQGAFLSQQLWIFIRASRIRNGMPPCVDRFLNIPTTRGHYTGPSSGEGSKSCLHSPQGSQKTKVFSQEEIWSGATFLSCRKFAIYFLPIWLIIFSQLPLIMQTRCFMTRNKHKKRKSIKDKSSMTKSHKLKETNKLSSLVTATLGLPQSIFSIQLVLVLSVIISIFKNWGQSLLLIFFSFLFSFLNKQ